ncbi:MAG: hypothetical protein ABIB71_04830 [Candidatus Woesearchaeota archaeon]
MKAPNKLTVEVKDTDVKKNLVKIVKTMEALRRECLSNMEQDDGIKLDYLLFSSELASCLEPQLKQFNANQHASKSMQYVGRDPLLLRYDDIQDSFWEKRQPNFKNSLDRATILLLKDNFTSTSQSYHIFQGLKYLYAGDDKEEVYDTILPFNSLLSESGLDDPIVTDFVMNYLFNGYMDQLGNGLGIALSGNNLGSPEFIERLKELGALYVDLPQNVYSKIKGKFPYVTVVEEKGEKKTRVLLRETGDAIIDVNIFDFFANHAVEKLNEKIEKNIKPGFIKSHYNFGKKFVEEMKEKLGIDVIDDKPAKPVKSPSVILTLDDVAAENGKYKTQNQWIEYWNDVKDGRRFPSMAELYQVFKQIAADKDANRTLLDSVRKDFKARLLLSSTRLQYNSDNENSRIIHNYRSDREQQPLDLDIPEYLDIPLKTVLIQDKGLYFFHALLGTEDTKEEITDVFEVISDKPKKDIKVWTPPFSDDTYTSRGEMRERAASLYYDSGLFRISCNLNLGNDGRSRAVLGSEATASGEAA